MQARIRTVIMRGGTSRGIFFRDEDLPVDPEARKWTILAAFGSPDRYGRQIDGLGGATSLTSKAAIISKGTQPGIDINFTFGQVSIEKPLIDMRGNCGNISAAVGPYAIDEGLVPCQEPMTRSISCVLGQMSRRYTGWPSGATPSGSWVRSTPIEPVSA